MRPQKETAGIILGSGNCKTEEAKTFRLLSGNRRLVSHLVLELRCSVEVRLNLGPDVLGDVAAQFQTGNVVGLDVIATHHARDASQFRDFGKGWHRQNDVARCVFFSDDLCQGTTIQLLHLLTGKPLLGDLTRVAWLDESTFCLLYTSDAADE